MEPQYEHSIPVFPGISNQLCIAALFAFPITYVIIKQWILNYVRQVSISPLPFILILIGLALTVIAGISWRVWKAANENPAEVIKNE